MSENLINNFFPQLFFFQLNNKINIIQVMRNKIKQSEKIYF
jgi:hypothetical protein